MIDAPTVTPNRRGFLGAVLGALAVPVVAFARAHTADHDALLAQLHRNVDALGRLPTRSLRLMVISSDAMTASMLESLDSGELAREHAAARSA